MAFRSRLLRAASCLGALAIGATAAAQTVAGDVAVSLLPLDRPDDHEFVHGYIEYRVHLENRAQEEREVVLELPARSGGLSGSSIRTITRTVRLPAGTSAVSSLPQPCLPLEGSDLRFRVGSRYGTLRLRLPAEPGYMTDSDGSDFDPAVLVSRSASTSELMRIRQLGGRVNLFHSELPEQEWLQSWLGYTRYDAVLADAAELSGAGPEVERALLGYVTSGGVLVITGTDLPPPSWNGSQVEPPVHPADGVTVYSYGFGVLVGVPRTDGRTISPHLGQADLLRLAGETLRPFRKRFGVLAAERHFAVAGDDIRVPATGILTVMLLFAGLAGPANLLVLRRIQQRMWVLWTVPALSLLACAGVWLYAGFAGGWHGRELTSAVTVLDQRSGSAATIGWTAFYSPRTPSQGLRFSYDTEVTPHVDRGFGRGGARTIDWTAGQHLKEGWISARVPAHFQVRKVEHGIRRRLQVDISAAGKRVAVNGLGSDIEELWLADGAGVLHRASRVAAGARVELVPLGERVQEQRSLRELYAADWLESAGTLRADPASFLGRSTYIAFLRSSPFLERALGENVSRSGTYAVFGLFEEERR